MIPVRKWGYPDRMTETRLVGDARAIASTWMMESDLPFFAAFIGGSVAHTPADAAYDPASDIDCYLVIEGDPPDGKIGKITVNGVLLDVSWIAWSQLEQSASDAVLASLLHFGVIVRDDGRLGELQQQISTPFTTPAAIEARLESMRAKIRNGLGGDSSHLPVPEQVMNWLFPATLATHIPLIRACAPLTVRKRFVAAKTVMAPDAYEALLALYGFDAVSREQANYWLQETEQLLDASAPLAAESHRFWATDILADAKPIAIGGSRQLIDAGLHREALYWIIATSARCLVVRADAGADAAPYLPAFTAMLTEMGLAKSEDRRQGSEKILALIDN